MRATTYVGIHLRGPIPEDALEEHLRERAAGSFFLWRINDTTTVHWATLEDLEASAHSLLRFAEEQRNTSPAQEANRAESDG